MADTKLSALTALTSLASGDLFHVLDDPAGTPVDKKITAANLLAYVEANISITESNISDLGTYLTDITGEALSTLSDVTITSIASGELLKWNGSAWVNNTLAEAGVAAASHTHTESDITDLGTYLTSIAGETVTDLDGTADRVLYINSTGDVTELALGASGTYLKSQGTTSAPTWDTPPGSGDALTTNPLSQFAATTSAQLAGVISNETGSGSLVFGTSPTIGTAALTTPTVTSDIVMVESADHASTPGAGYGYLWVKNDTPNSLYFTDDAGTDYQLNGTEVTGTSGQIYVFNGSNQLAAVTMSGDATIAAGGALTIGTGVVDVSMLADGTDGELITWGADGVATTVATGTSGYVLTSNGAGAAPTFQAAAGGGNVSNSGTPVDGQIGVWTSASAIEGDSALTFDTTTDSLVIAASGSLDFGAVTILSDSAGTMTLSNVDALDATTEATIEAAIDTLGALSLTGTLSMADNDLSRPNILDYSVESVGVSSSANVTTLNLANGNDHTTTLSENTTIAFSGWPPSGTLGKVTLQITQDSTARTVAWTNVDAWPGGTAPTMSTGSGAIDEYVFWSRDNGFTVYGATVGQDMS